MAIDVDTPRGTASPPVNPRNPRFAVALALLVGLVLGSAITWWIEHPRPSDRFPVRILQGDAYFTADRDVFALSDPAGSFLGGFAVGHAEGRECIPTTPDPSSADPILIELRVGVVAVAPTAHQSGREIVVWIECLGPPSPP